MKRLLITCTDAEEREFLELARQYKTSPSLLGQHAIRQLLAASREGVRPMLKRSTKKGYVAPLEAFAVGWVDDPT